MVRKNSTAITALLVAVLLTLTACGGSQQAANGSGSTGSSNSSGSTSGSSSGSGSSSSASYNANNSVTEATDISDAVTLDPQKAYEFSSTAADQLLYATLVKFPYGNLKKPEGGLAKNWDISNNGKKYVFHLKQNAVFSNGDPVTAQDVVYTFKRVVNLKKDPASWLITQTGINAKNVGQNVKAIDDHTVQITLPKKFSPGAFLAIMANSVVGIVDAKVVKQHVSNGDWGTGWLYNHSAGAGPYQLQNWTKDVDMKFVANPKYNLGPAPKIKMVDWKNVKETTARVDMLKKGDASIVTGLTASQVKQLQGNSNYQVLKAPQEAMTYVGMGVKTVPALGNPDVREAVKYAINYKSIVDNLLNGNGIELQGIIPKGLFGYVNSTPFHYNISKAKSLLKKGGYPDGFSATMLVPNGNAFGGVPASALAEAIKSNLAKAGIKINIRQMEASQMYTEYRHHKAQMILAGWGMDYPDPQDFAAPFADYTQKSLIWRLQDDDKSLAQLVEKSATMENTPERQKLYNQINDKLKTGPFAIMYQPDQVIVYSKNVSNLQWDELNGIDFPLLSKSK